MLRPAPRPSAHTPGARGRTRAAGCRSHPSQTRPPAVPIVRVMSDQTIFPALRYRDAPAAIEWLGRAFGFEARMVVDGSDGNGVPAEPAFYGAPSQHMSAPP